MMNLGTAHPKRAAAHLGSFFASKLFANSIVHYHQGQDIYVQGDPGICVFYVKKGRVKISVASSHGKEAVISLLGSGDFFGEGCMGDQTLRVANAKAVLPSWLVRIGKVRLTGLLRKNRNFADCFISSLVSRISKLEDNLVDQLFNPSEKRLARILLLLARYGKRNGSETVIPTISQETLADMIGTTRSRVNYFMNRFRKLGFVEYNGEL